MLSREPAHTVVSGNPWWFGKFGDIDYLTCPRRLLFSRLNMDLKGGYQPGRNLGLLRKMKDPLLPLLNGGHPMNQLAEHHPGSTFTP